MGHWAGRPALRSKLSSELQSCFKIHNETNSAGEAEGEPRGLSQSGPCVPRLVYTTAKGSGIISQSYFRIFCGNWVIWFAWKRKQTCIPPVPGHVELLSALSWGWKPSLPQGHIWVWLPEGPQPSSAQLLWVCSQKGLEQVRTLLQVHSWEGGW